MTTHVPRFNRRVLTVFLLVGIPALAVGAGLVLLAGQSRLSDDYGRHLSQVAQQTSSAVDSYVYRVLTDVFELGRSPTLRQAVAAANRAPYDAASVARLDEAWRAGGSLPAGAAGVLESAAALFLADVSRHDRVYVELLVTDRRGRLVAASNRVSDYDQADEDWWMSAYDGGVTGRLTVTSVRWDESARRHAIEIAAPVPEPGSEALGGIIKVVADSREMLSLVGGLRLGATGEAMLLLDDGTIVFSRDVLAPDTRFFALDDFREHAAAVRGGDPRQPAHFRAAAAGHEPIVVGLAPSGLTSSFPTLPWIVAVTQSEAELLAPVRSLGWYLLAAFALSAIAVLVFALWFSIRLAESPVATDLHLVHHPPVMHVGTTDEPILAEDEA